MKFSVYDTGEIAMNYQEAMEYMEKVGTYGIVRQPQERGGR